MLTGWKTSNSPTGKFTFSSLIMRKPKYIPQKNLPICLMHEEHPDFHVYRYEHHGNDLKLYYLVEGRGISVHFQDKERFEKFPEIIEVESGGWYGEKGRWSPVERYNGVIKIYDVSSFSKKEQKIENYSVKVKKGFFSSKLKVQIESSDVGVIKFYCSKLEPEKYQILLFSKYDFTWKLRKEVLENLDDYYNGEVEQMPF